jgi:lipid-A-disaccharide synthase
MLAAGEASGDLHGATLCRALRSLAPGVRLHGMGGPRMAEAGMQVLVDVSTHAIVGGSEALGGIPRLYRAYRRMVEALRATPPPRALVLIDFPEFNLRLARAARRAGVPVVYFIPPQVWAWREGRVRTIARRVTRVLAVFPFEAPLYRAAGVPVDFVGHPLVDGLTEAPPRAEARKRLGLPEAAPVLGLLPGSRAREIERLLPAMRDAALAMARERPGLRAVLALAPTVDRGLVQRLLAGAPGIALVERDTHAVMAAADLLLVASGTATLEAALLGTPMIICYRVSHLSYRLFLLLVRVSWIGLPNIVLGRPAAPELYQENMTGARLAREARRLLSDPAALAAQRTAFAELLGAFGPPGVGARAARLVLRAAGIDLLGGGLCPPSEPPPGIRLGGGLCPPSEPPPGIAPAKPALEEPVHVRERRGVE